MNIQKKLLSAATLLLIMIGTETGCVPNRPWRTSPTSTQNLPDSQSSWLKGTHGEDLFVVEFDDQGESFGHSQPDFALEHIREMAQDPSDKRPLMVMVFVHGWHHSAKAGDANLESFRRVLSDLAQAPGLTDRRWVGVYIGWRGESVNFPLLRYLTYWNRRNAAARVGGIPFARFLAELSSIVQSRDENMMMAIGHSFGGRVVETAVTNAMAFDEGKPKLDLVVLLNEASEGLRAKMSIDAIRHDTAKSQVPREPQPEFVSLTSVGDSATGVAFPLGQWLPSLNQRFQDYSQYGDAREKTLAGQESLFRHTAGHTSDLWSHAVKTPDQVPDWSNRQDVTPFSIHDVLPGPKPDYLLVPIDNSFNQGTPYWIIQVPKEIIFDHDDIFNNQVRGLLAGIIKKWFEEPAKVKGERLKTYLQRKESKEKIQRSKEKSGTNTPYCLGNCFLNFEKTPRTFEISAVV